jgi:hypothetical protein
MSENGIIREKAFARRLAQACSNHPRAPSGHGQQTWVRKAMLESFAIKVSPEGIRKWFAGEARPRPKTMSKLAQLLSVDEAWLSLGITPVAEPRAKNKMNALANGAVNLVAGQIQLAGGTIAFADGDDDHDIFAIVKGKQVAISVKLVSDQLKSTVSIVSTDKPTILVLPTFNKTVFRFFRVPSNLTQEFGENRGGYTEIELDVSADQQVFIAGNAIPEIKDFRDINGIAPIRSETNDGISDGIAPKAPTKSKIIS